MEEEHKAKLIDELVTKEKESMREDAAYAKETGREHLVTDDQTDAYLYDMFNKMTEEKIVELHNYNFL